MLFRSDCERETERETERERKRERENLHGSLLAHQQHLTTSEHVSSFLLSWRGVQGHEIQSDDISPVTLLYHNIFVVSLE